MFCRRKLRAPVPDENKIYQAAVCREDGAMKIRPDSVHFRILDRLCRMPKAVRGMAPAMLQRTFGDLSPVEDLASAGLLKKRGWADGPGWIWIPTEAGEALYRSMSTAPRKGPAVTSTDRVIMPANPRAVPADDDQRSS